MTEFQKAIFDFIEEYPQHVQYLADHFEVAPSTVVRWIHGVAVPHPRVQELILAQLAEIKTLDP